MSGDERPDIRRLVERLKRCLITGPEGNEAEFANDVRLYSLVCAEANQRLQECHFLASKGQYAQVVAAADREPNLMEDCAVLHFRESELLAKAAQTQGLQPPELLNPVWVSSLQDAYNKSLSEVSLLRRLVLARAPLPSRLAVMRQMLKKTRNNQILEQDIRELEEAWINQVTAFCLPFAEAGNDTVVQEVIDDLKFNGYKITVPAKRFQNLENLLSHARQQRLPPLAASIQEAFEGRQHALLLQLTREWIELCKSCKVDPYSPEHGVNETLEVVKQLAERDKAQREWAEAQVERAKRKQRLQFELDNPKTSRKQLEQVYEAAHRNHLVEEDDTVLYEQRIRAFESASQRNRIFVAFFVTVIMLAVAIFAYSTYSSWMYNTKLEEVLDTISEQVNARDFVRAEGSFETLAKPFLEESRVKELRSRIDKGKVLDRQVLAIRNAATESELNQCVEAANASAQSLEDRQFVETTKQEWLANQRKAMDEAAKETQEKIAAIKRDLIALESSNLRWNATLLRNSITELNGRVDQLSGSPFPSQSEFDRQVAELTSMIRKLESQADAAEKIKRSIDQSTSSAATPGTVKALAVGLGLPAADEVMLQSILTLSQELAGLKPPSLPNSWKTTPIHSQIRKIETELAKLKRRSKDAGACSAITKRLKEADLGSLWCVKAGEFQYPFYATVAPKKSRGDKISFEALNAKKALEGYYLELVDDPFPAPQSSIAEEVRKKLNEISSDSWHDNVVCLYERMWQESAVADSKRKCDPVLRCELMALVLSKCVEDSTGFETVLKSLNGVSELREKSSEVTPKWVSPYSEDELIALRSQMEGVCNSAPKLTAAHCKLARDYDVKIVEQIKTSVSLLGMLDASAATVQVRNFPSVPNRPGAMLYVISSGKWIEIGKTDDSLSVMLESNSERFVGHPVIQILTLD